MLERSALAWPALTHLEHGVLLAAAIIALIAGAVAQQIVLALPRPWAWWASVALQVAFFAALAVRALSVPGAVLLIPAPGTAHGILISPLGRRYYIAASG